MEYTTIVILAQKNNLNYVINYLKRSFLYFIFLLAIHM